MSKVAVLGSGVVGETLANGFAKHGHEVMRASREPSKLGEWKSGHAHAVHVGDFAEAAKWADIVVLAVKGTAAESAIALAGPDNLAGKTVIDATNPIADEAPEDGVLRFFTIVNESLMERLQNIAPDAKFVKAFSCVGSHLMIEPKLAGGRPTMFVCGNDAGAKNEVRGILEVFGWDMADMGTVKGARAIEPLCMLWCIPGLRENSWAHAFKLLKV